MLITVLKLKAKKKKSLVTISHWTGTDRPQGELFLSVPPEKPAANSARVWYVSVFGGSGCKEEADKPEEVMEEEKTAGEHGCKCLYSKCLFDCLNVKNNFYCELKVKRKQTCHKHPRLRRTRPAESASTFDPSLPVCKMLLVQLPQQCFTFTGSLNCWAGAGSTLYKHECDCVNKRVANVSRVKPLCWFLRFVRVSRLIS